MSRIDCPYTVRVIENHDYGQGCWNGQRIGIYKNEEKIGEYLRNYHSYGESTFAPFQQGDNWFALYSEFYTCTELMELPSCNKIGGEKRESGGFCPVELYVPQIYVRTNNTPKPYNPRHDPSRWATIDAARVYTWKDNDPEYQQLIKEFDQKYNIWDEENPLVWKFAPFGFIAGCHWGDDCSWKVRFVNLERVIDGIILTDDRFGYLELPTDIGLKDAIDLDCYDEENPQITIAARRRFTLFGEELDREV